MGKLWKSRSSLIFQIAPKLICAASVRLISTHNKAWTSSLSADGEGATASSNSCWEGSCSCHQLSLLPHVTWEHSSQQHAVELESRNLQVSRRESGLSQSSGGAEMAKLENGASATLPELKDLEAWCHSLSLISLFIWHVKQSHIRSGVGHKSGIATDVTGKEDSSGLKPGNKSYLVWLQLSWLLQDCSTAVWQLSGSAA